MIEFFIEILSDWPVGTIFGMVMIAIALFIIGLVAYFINYALDSWFIQTKRGKGKIVNKNFTPAHTSTVFVYNATLKTSSPSTLYHPPSWSLTVDIDEQ
ncbi:MAG: hypothetical protein HYW78_01285 [Parcubacteria group bacterium]|nr:hypothetical protein [Parcubacteria group bacterium]